MLTFPVYEQPLPNGETLAYRMAGSGDEIIVLIHGNMSSSAHFTALMRVLSSRFRLFAVDLRGFGGSSYRQPIRSLADFADDLNMFVKALDLPPFTLLGWSMGGGVVMEYAARYCSDVKRLILLESVGYRGYPIYRKDAEGRPIPGELLSQREDIANDPVQVRPILEAYATRNKDVLQGIWNALIYRRRRPNPEEYDLYLEEMLRQRNLIDVDVALAHFNMSDASNGVAPGNGLIRRITMPTLVLWGEDDVVVTRQMAEETARAIGPNALLRIQPGWGHAPMVDDLAGLSATIERFIDGTMSGA